MFNLELTRVDGHPVDALPEFYLAVGLSKRNVHHVVIYSGSTMVHDPHYSNEGLLAVDYCYYLNVRQGDYL